MTTFRTRDVRLSKTRGRGSSTRMAAASTGSWGRRRGRQRERGSGVVNGDGGGVYVVVQSSTAAASTGSCGRPRGRRRERGGGSSTTAAVRTRWWVVNDGGSENEVVGHQPG